MIAFLHSLQDGKVKIVEYEMNNAMYAHSVSCTRSSNLLTLPLQDHVPVHGRIWRSRLGYPDLLLVLHGLCFLLSDAGEDRLTENITIQFESFLVRDAVFDLTTGSFSVRVTSFAF
jgi:hypothetical protein